MKFDFTDKMFILRDQNDENLFVHETFNLNT